MLQMRDCLLQQGRETSKLVRSASELLTRSKIGRPQRPPYKHYDGWQARQNIQVAELNDERGQESGRSSSTDGLQSQGWRGRDPTLAVNIAAALASAGKSVLLVDARPQCNLTSYLLEDEVVGDLLQQSDSKEGKTIWTRCDPSSTARATREALHRSTLAYFRLLPRYPTFQFEEFLSDAWADSFKARLSGVRATTAIHSLVNRLVDLYDFDFVFYDTGPNIGTRPRSIARLEFLSRPSRATFLVRALSTLGQTLKRWILIGEQL